jgi:Tfp pilus assembly protein PilX
MNTAPHFFACAQRQRGATLIVALVMLVALAMLGIWAFNGSTTNSRIVGNMQVRQEAMDAAQAALETTISSQLFTAAPAAVAASAVNVQVNGVTYAVWLKDKDGNKKPACYRVKAIKQKELDVTAAADKNCMKDTGKDLGIESDVPPTTVTTGDSLCSNSEWNVYAEVTDANTGAFVAINQGVAARVLTTHAENACPSS